jgi:hypothetical protein
MNEQERLFSQLTPDEQKYLSAFYKEALETNFRESRNAAWELAKVLLTVNSGAAAGLFIVIRSSAANLFLTDSFYTFCFGVFFVVAAYFTGAVQFSDAALKFEENVQLVYQNKLSPMGLTRRIRQSVRGKWSYACPILGGMSFACIILGGVLTALFLIKEPKQISPQQFSDGTNSVLRVSAPLR